jgi:hypothetical protein
MEYTLYFLDETGRVAQSHYLICTTESAAMDEAQKMKDGRSMEIWQHERRIAELDKDGIRIIARADRTSS